MRTMLFLTTEFKDPNEISQKIVNTIASQGATVTQEDTYDNSDFDLRFQNGLISFDVSKQDDYDEDVFNHNNLTYYTTLYIVYSSVLQGVLNSLIGELLYHYPDAIVSDEMCEEFFSREDLNNRNVPEWLLE